MEIETVLCERCGGEVGSLQNKFICKECKQFVSDEYIQKLLKEAFEKYEKQEGKI